MNMELVLQNIQDGIMISIIGMGFVMCFLTLMMGFMRVTESIMLKLNEIFPEEKKEEIKKITNNNKDEELAVAIAVAKYKELIKGGI